MSKMEELAALDREMAELEARRRELLESRKKDIGEMFGRMGLLDLEDALVFGLLVEARDADPARRAALIDKGKQFVRGKPGRKAGGAKATESAPAPVTVSSAEVAPAMAGAAPGGLDVVGTPAE